ncbi:MULTISPECIES: Fic family protein [Nitrosomonas]|nr:MULTISPECIES: Fic family protein [Nitrosomonas]TYP87805.1 Fic/DOC family protein [Nitrosomonas communis]UVS60517.1 Fic family protein [Nitrosomonas sp. PLL12]
MKNKKNNRFSEEVSIFQERRLPEKAILAGYSALINAYDLAVPLPHKLSAIGARHKIYEEDDWYIYTPRHMPEASIEGHLVFALKYEGLDLAVLKRLFEAVTPEEIEHIIKTKPTSSYTRRLWFLYEWLLGRELDLPDAKTGSYIDIVDSKQQWAIHGITSTRHRVRNNLPGTRAFCPLVFRTKTIEQYVASNLAERAQEVVGRISADILARTVAFLLLKDSKSSYAIEGEAPPQNRIQRWGRAIGEAGRRPLDLDELLRLQRIVIGDSRFITMGLRTEGGFVGEHEFGTRLPLPEHISARPEDLPDLMRGMIDFDRYYAGELDAVIAAAILAFGFVYIHPFEDGNGRLHRYLIHHVLAQRGFNPAGVIFPVSASILERIDEYRLVLESYSKRLLSFIEWEPTKKMNAHVLNDTGDFYRYFDATPHVEFLYACVEKTIDFDLPREADFLKRCDLFKTRVESFIEMPDSMIDLLFNFLKQNNGHLSKRAKEKEFAALTAGEVDYIEKNYAEIFQNAYEVC